MVLLNWEKEKLYIIHFFNKLKLNTEIRTYLNVFMLSAQMFETVNTVLSELLTSGRNVCVRLY